MLHTSSFRALVDGNWKVEYNVYICICIVLVDSHCCLAIKKVLKKVIYTECIVETKYRVLVVSS